MEGQMEPKLDIKAILNLLPHRYPMLLVDRVVEITEKSIVGLKNVSINEDFFNGHFPGHPIMPGVLIIEAMAQAAGLFMVNSCPEVDRSKKLVYFMTIEEAHFRKPVVPGDALYLHIEQVKQKGNVWKMKGEARVNDKRVANALFSAMMVDR
jgi:3-hydroxyacyl-[acyl-carrier-protein] dehydratase